MFTRICKLIDIYMCKFDFITSYCRDKYSRTNSWQFKNYLQSENKRIVYSIKSLLSNECTLFYISKTVAIYWQIDKNILINKLTFLYKHVTSSMSDNEQNKTNHERINSEVLLNHNYINILTHVEIKTKKNNLYKNRKLFMNQFLCPVLCHTKRLSRWTISSIVTSYYSENSEPI